MIRFHIANMSCGGCERAVRATLAEAAPGAPVEVALASREIAVGGGDAARIEAALRDAGWEAVRLGA